MKRIDNEAGEAYWNFAICGPGGVGKTTMGVSAPKPLIVLSERQGMPSIRLAAKRLGRPVPPVALVEEADDYRAVLKALRGPRDKPFRIVADGQVVMELPVEEWPESVVIDSLTDACDVLVAEIRKISPPKKGRDGLPVDAQRFWGVLIDRATGIIKGFRDLPMHVVFLCLVSDKTKEDKDGRILERIVQPKLATKDMANALCAAVNVLGYAYKTLDRDKNVVHGFMTQGPEGMMTKPCEPLRGREVPDVANMIARLQGNLEDVPTMPLAPEAMDASRGDEAPPPADEEPDTQPEGYQCTNCGAAAVEQDGDMCQPCEDKVFGDAEAAAKADQESEAEEPEGAEPEDKPKGNAKQVPCQQCGRRMSPNTKDRACDGDDEHQKPASPMCVPMKTAADLPAAAGGAS